MINIEKIYTNYTSSPGIIDTFINNDPLRTFNTATVKAGNITFYTPEMYSETIIALSDNQISYSTKFGYKGVNVYELLSSTVFDNTYYEISAYELLSMPMPQVKFLCKHYKLIVHDFAEMGEITGLFINKYRHLVFRDLVICAGNADIGNFLFDEYGREIFVPSNVQVINIPATVLWGIATQITKYGVCKERPVPTKDIFIPCYKPRHYRGKTLAMLDQHQLLDNSTWTLDANPTLYKDRLGQELGSLYQDRDTANFMEKYRTVLPKRIVDKDSDTGLASCDGFDLMYANHKWYIACETYVSHCSLSEKSIKGFLLNIPTLVVSSKGFNQYLLELGFKLEGDYDHAETFEKRVHLIIEHIENKEPDYKIADHNLNHCLDTEFWAKLVVDQILKIKK